MGILTLLVAVLILADLLTTDMALQAGAVELNPLPALLIKLFGIWGIIITHSALIVTLFVWPPAPFVLGMLAGLFAAAVRNNFRAIKQVRAAAALLARVEAAIKGQS